MITRLTLSTDSNMLPERLGVQYLKYTYVKRGPMKVGGCFSQSRNPEAVLASIKMGVDRRDF